jgi:hypothetical protein
MNRKKVAKMQDKKVRIQPATRVESTGQELPPIDDWWHIDSASKDQFGSDNRPSVPTNRPNVYCVPRHGRIAEKAGERSA